MIYQSDLYKLQCIRFPARLGWIFPEYEMQVLEYLFPTSMVKELPLDIDIIEL
jgi:hypothetical protein